MGKEGGGEEEEVAVVGQQALAEDGTLPSPQIAFLIDGMLGRLCKWMRVVGLDVELHEYQKPVQDKALKAITPPPILVKAQESQRLVLTRDRKLVHSRFKPQVCRQASQWMNASPPGGID